MEKEAELVSGVRAFACGEQRTRKLNFRSSEPKVPL
jgi:hypothetical protein